MKRVLILLFSVVISMVLSAQEKNTLVIQLYDGGLEKYILSDKPNVSFIEENMTISVDSIVKLDIKRSLVEKFHFEYVNPTIVEDSKINSYTFYYDGQKVKMNGLDSDNIVTVLTIEGKIISTHTIDSVGNVVISLDSLPQGLYIISYKDRSVKIRVI